MLARRCACLALLLAPLGSACLGTGSSINAYGGSRSLDSNDFDGVDDQTAYGADLVWKLDAPWLAVEGGWLRAEDDSSGSGTLTNLDLTVDEYFAGLRLTPWEFLIEPYGAAGVSYLTGDLDATSGGNEVGGSDGAFGYYARLGAALRLAFFRIGIDGRLTFSSELDLDAIESDANSYQLTAFLGFAF